MSDFKEKYPKDELPFDKFKKMGSANLSDAELLAIMLRTGTKQKNPIELGRDILQLSGEKWGLLGLHHMTLRDLMKIPGIGEVKAIQLLCIAELAARISTRQAQHTLSFEHPETVADYYMERMRHRTSEQIILILLDAKNRLISDEVISTGTVNASLISVREIMIRALKAEAAYSMLLHNHPSGDPTPSKQDLLVTKKVQEAAELVEIPLLDHIIIGDNRYLSFRQRGLL